MKKQNPPIRIREANLQDAHQLGRLHYRCSLEQPEGFMHRLGCKFLIEYYKILLKNESSVIICAEDDQCGIVGLVSASLKMEKELESLKKNSIKLLLSAATEFLKHPSLIKEVLNRGKALFGAIKGKGYIVGAGARIGYWGWRSDYPRQNESIRLLKTLLSILTKLGIHSIRLEVDHANKKVKFTHLMMGAKVVKEFETADGRKRIIMEHRL